MLFFKFLALDRSHKNGVEGGIATPPQGGIFEYEARSVHDSLGPVKGFFHSFLLTVRCRTKARLPNK